MIACSHLAPNPTGTISMSVVDEVPHFTDSSDDEFVIGASAQDPKKRRRRAPLGAAGSLACFFYCATELWALSPMKFIGCGQLQ